jgi:ABC-type multidrug transport system fused ATPase/permease subunit
MLALRLHRSNRSIGSINNNQSKDSAALRDFVVFSHNLWSCPLMIIGCVLSLFHFIGVSGLVPCILLPILIPLQSSIARRAKAIRAIASSKSDARMASIHELLDGIRTVKLTGLGPFIFQKIQLLREAELQVFLQFKMMEAANSVITKSQSLLITLATFGVYSYVSADTITADQAFCAMSIISIIGRPMQVIPKSFSLLSAAQIACNRITDLWKDAQRFQNDPVVTCASNVSDRSLVQSVSVRFDDFSASRGDGTSVLHKISTKLDGPGLIVIVGPNGSGKTSLLLSIIQELQRSTGNVRVHPSSARIGYCGHSSWILNDTVLNNVRLAEPENPVVTFEQAFRMAALDQDILEWPQGSSTLLGEKGICISGGQKYRIALARAFYSNSDILLLDSPFAAVDENVADALLKSIREYSKSHLVIVTSHHDSILRFASKIVKLDGGNIVFDGGWSEYQQLFASIHVSGCETRSHDSTQLPMSPPVISRKSAATSNAKSQNKPTPQQNLWKSVSIFCDACSYSRLALVVILSFLAFAMVVLGDFATAKRTDAVYSTNTYLFYLFISTMLALTFNFVRFTLFSSTSVRASSHLHRKLLESTIGTTFPVLDTTPSGQFISRFSSDMEVVDSRLSGAIISLFEAAISMVFNIGAVCFSSPLYAVFVFPLAWFYLNVQMRYRRAASHVKRLESNAKSASFGYFREVIEGLETIRGYQIEDKMFFNHFLRFDRFSRAKMNWDICNRWLGIRVDMIGASMIALAALSVPATMLFSTSAAFGSMAGLLLSFATKATHNLSFAIRASTDLESQFTSVDRIQEFSELPQETEPDELPLHACHDPTCSIPKSGFDSCHLLVSASNISAAYGTSSISPPILNNLSFEVPHCHGVGRLIAVAGRTGCGKSSLSMILARAYPIQSGQLLVCDKPHTVANLNDYRSLITLIPQDYFIFSGSIRSFLDPYNRHTDESLEQFLIHVWRGVDRPLLSSSLLPGGSNLSAGERQQLILARCLLDKSCKLMILDETVSHMDSAGSLSAVERIRSELIGHGVSVLLITHRPDVMRLCDELWWMESGAIVDAGNPSHIISNRFE